MGRWMKPISIITAASLAILSISILSACSHTTKNLDNVNTLDIRQLENIRVTPSSPSSSGTKTDMSSLRLKVLQESAMSISAQSGLAWSANEINTRLLKDAKYLDSIYNFNAMMLSHGVMPPVLEQGDNTLNLADPNTIRVSDKMYKIVQQAHFATTAPTWREYIILSYYKPELPDKSLLPRNAIEQEVWRKGIRSGWQKGIEQSYTIFQQGLARLNRDYRGMMLYRKLLQQKMISPPFVSRTELGVTGNGTDMRVNDQVLRIVELPQLQTNSRHWQAIVVKNHG